MYRHTPTGTQTHIHKYRHIATKIQNFQKIFPNIFFLAIQMRYAYISPKHNADILHRLCNNINIHMCTYTCTHTHITNTHTHLMTHYCTISASKTCNVNVSIWPWYIKFCFFIIHQLQFDLEMSTHILTHPNKQIHIRTHTKARKSSKRGHPIFPSQISKLKNIQVWITAFLYEV